MAVASERRPVDFTVEDTPAPSIEEQLEAYEMLREMRGFQLSPDAIARERELRAVQSSPREVSRDRNEETEQQHNSIDLPGRMALIGHKVFEFVRSAVGGRTGAMTPEMAAYNARWDEWESLDEEEQWRRYFYYKARLELQEAVAGHNKRVEHFTVLRPQLLKRYGEAVIARVESEPDHRRAISLYRQWPAIKAAAQQRVLEFADDERYDVLSYVIDGGNNPTMVKRAEQILAEDNLWIKTLQAGGVNFKQYPFPQNEEDPRATRISEQSVSGQPPAKQSPRATSVIPSDSDPPKQAQSRPEVVHAIPLQPSTHKTASGLSGDRVQIRPVSLVAERASSPHLPAVLIEGSNDQYAIQAIELRQLQSIAPNEAQQFFAQGLRPNQQVMVFQYPLHYAKHGLAEPHWSGAFRDLPGFARDKMRQPVKRMGYRYSDLAHARWAGWGSTTARVVELYKTYVATGRLDVRNNDMRQAA